jgi:hypothetical protein
VSDTSPQGVQDDAVNPNAAPPYVEFAGPTNIGWYYAPTVSYTLTGVFSYFRPVPNGTGTRTMTVQIWTDREAAGGTLLAQATFTADSDTGGLLGADFAPVTIQSGQTYFVDFLNSEGMGVDLGQYQIVDGVEEPSAGATTLLSAFYGTSAAGDDTFSGGPLHGDVVTGGGPVSFEEPILYFYGPGAAPVVNTATPINFGNVHPGANLPLSIGNAASATTGLDASVGGTSGDAVATGSVTQLVPGGTDDSIGVGLGGSAVGAQTGSVTLDFASDSGSGTPTALPSQTIQLSGTVYREAAATIAPIDEIVHVGDAGSVALGVANSDPADGFSENLIATLTDATGGLSVTGGGPTGELAPGQSDPDAFALGFSTAQAATIAGTADVGLVSDGGTGVGSIDGLGETTLTPDAVPVTITVDNYAQPAFDLENDGGTGAAITGSGADYVLNLGTIAQGSGDLTLGIGALNAASGPADLLSGSLSASGSGAIMASGLGGFADLAAGQTGPAGTVTVDTTATGSFSETLTLRSQGSNASGYSAALPDETLTVEGTVAPLAAPVVSAPKSQTVFAGMAAVLGPIGITDADAGDGPVTVVISDVSGILSAAATVGSVTVSGNDSRTLTLIGSLADVNAELASLTYTGQSNPDSDSVTFVATDSSHATTSTDLQLTIGSVALSPPVLNLPPTLAVVAGTTSALGGLSVTDPYAEATGEPLSVQLTFGPQTVLSETGNSGATVTGVGTNTITLSGSLDQINADLSDPPLLENPLGLALTLEEVQFIQYLAGPGSLINNQTFINGGPVFFGNLVLRAAESLINEYGSITAAIANFHAVTGGGAILDTFSGQTYSFQGAGEYLLAAATQQGDSFEVQARFQPFDNSAFISVMTQIAAAIGSDRVTFGIGRADTVWVDGAAAALGVGTSMSLSGGQLTQLSSDSYELTWNTGETLTVTNEGTYLDLNVGLGSGDGPGSVAGLLGPNEGIANDFTLPDGTELQEPISSTELYQTFANSWRIPQQFSLFDYATGQTTATFTDPTFPAQAPSLADLPASVVAQAASVVAAAGITIPALQSIVELDYIETGDPGIVTTDAALFNGISVAAGQVSAGGPAALAIGVEASGQQQANADEQVTFTVYLTAAAIADTTVDYQLETPDATFLTAAAFGGIAPSGQVVIPAGQTTSTFTITVPLSALGTSASANLGVQISSPASVPLVVPTAQTTIVNPPTPGPPPEPEIAPLFSFGTFTHIGNDYTLSLGALQFGQFLPTLQFAVINAAAAGADELGGTFTVAPSVGFTVLGASLPQPIAAGQDYEGLTLTPTETKIDSESTEIITFTPVDTNPSGYSATLAPLTLTITDTIVPPTMYYSEAWGDVHIVTYNGLAYDFQAAGEFILAQSSLPDDSFDIQLRLQPFWRNPVVSVITQVAISLGADRVTFGLGRQDFVQVDDAPTSLSLSDPVLSLPGGKIVEISPGQFQVTWNTGEEMTVTSFGSFLDVTDGIPFAELGHVAGLQGEGEGQATTSSCPTAPYWRSR